MPHRSLFCIHPSCRSSSSPTGDFLCSLHCRSSDCSRRSLHPYFPTAVAEHASAEATFSFRCRSRARFRRSHILFQTLQQLMPPQKPFLYFPYCHSSSCSRRSLYLSLSAVKSSAEANFSFQIPPQQNLHQMTSSTPLTFSLAFWGS